MQVLLQEGLQHGRAARGKGQRVAEKAESVTYNDIKLNFYIIRLRRKVALGCTRRFFSFVGCELLLDAKDEKPLRWRGNNRWLFLRIRDYYTLGQGCPLGQPYAHSSLRGPIEVISQAHCGMPLLKYM